MTIAVGTPIVTIETAPAASAPLSQTDAPGGGDAQSETAEGGAEGGGAVLVRYAWAAVPFQYKTAGLYAEGLPAGPFVYKATMR